MSEKKQAETRLIQAQCNLIAARDAHREAELEQLRAGRALADIEALECERRKEAGIVAVRELRELSRWFENDCHDPRWAERDSADEGRLVPYAEVSDKLASALARVELVLCEPSASQPNQSSPPQPQPGHKRGQGEGGEGED